MIVYDILNKLGYNVQPTEMDENIRLWAQWRRGKVDSFHKYNWYNGERDIQCVRSSLQLAKSVTESWADLLFSEKCVITVEGEDIANDEEFASQTAAFVKSVFDSNNLWIRLSEAQELKCAYGTVAYIPRARNVGLSAGNGILGGGDIITDVITANMIIPLSWENGVINEIAVVSDKAIGGVKYAYFQLFVLNGVYEIHNLLYKIPDAGCYVPIEDITAIPGFEKIPAKISTGSRVRPFVIDRPNIANNIDPRSPLGISVYANAVDAMMQCDLTFDSMSTEISLGRTRIFVAPEMLKNLNGKPYFDPKDAMFQFMPGLAMGANSVNSYIEVVQPQLRIAELEEGLRLALNVFSSKCGLGENYYRYSGGAVTTATQIISEQSAAFRAKKKHETVLEAALYDLIRLIIDIGINTMKMSGLKPEPQIKISFGDSIIEDVQALKKQDMLEVSQGIMKNWEYRMKWYGETEEQAKAAAGADAGVQTEPAPSVPLQ